MLEAFKLAGAIVAFVTAFFTVWDRLARGRPLAWVTAKKIGAGSFEFIRIKNPGPADVLILGVRARPPIYGVTRDHSSEAILEALSFNNDVKNVLLQGEGCDLPIVPNRVKLPKNAPSQRVRFIIYWRKTSSSWLRQFPVVIWTSTGDIERISAAAGSILVNLAG
jgi:hypothetical protein